MIRVHEVPARSGLSVTKKIAGSGYKIALGGHSELNVDNWNDNCEAKSEAKVPGLYAVCR